MSRRLTLVLLFPIVLLGACNGGDDASPSTTFAPPLTNPPLATTTTTIAETTTTATTTTTTTAVPEATAGSTQPTTDSPTVTEPGEPGEPDWLRIVSELAAIYDELQREPAIERIDEYCAPGGNPCQETLGGTIRFLAEEGYRVEGLPLAAIESAQLSATSRDAPIAEAEFVVVTVKAGEVDMSESRVVDGDGTVVVALDPDGDTSTTLSNWILVPLPEGTWRVLDIMDVGG